MKKNRTKSASSSRWLARQQEDVYVRKARESHYRSRAAFKLEQLDSRDRLFRAGQNVLDLGAAPGGWSQYLANRTGPRGMVVAIDLLPVIPIPGVKVLQGDFLEEEVMQQVAESFQGRPVDAIVSDMAPNISGIRERDEARSRELVEAARVISIRLLRRGGLLVVKIFESGDRKRLVDEFRTLFGQVAVRKPDASRRDSAECYMVARGYNPEEQS